MATTLTHEPIVARDEERSRIEQLEHLYEQDTPRQPGSVRIVGANGVEIELPESILILLRQVVHVLARGEAVSIVPVQKELTTQQAADLLNISRQYLIRVLDRGEIPFHMVGTHRRLAFGDVMEYKRRRDAERRRGFDALTQLCQELGLYDSGK
ncbi:MAG: helix-turn-helix domain-containing protein [Thermomicrobiales bacterium]